jgi:hypothetical protein
VNNFFGDGEATQSAAEFASNKAGFASIEPGVQGNNKLFGEVRPNTSNEGVSRKGKKK